MLDIHGTRIQSGDIVRYMTSAGEYRYKHIVIVGDTRMSGFAARHTLEEARLTLGQERGGVVNFLGSPSARKTLTVIWRDGKEMPIPLDAIPKPALKTLAPKETKYQIGHCKVTCVDNSNALFDHF